MSAPTVLVTGASGFVGGALLGALAARAIPAVGLVRPGREGAGIDGVTWRAFDAWTEAALARAIGGADVVIHAASVVHRPGASEDEFTRFNTEGSRALAAACAARGVKRVVFLSTIKVYGETPPGVIDEATPLAPEGGYARTKALAEQIFLDLNGGGDRSAIALRLCPVFGRGDKGNVRTMIRAIARRRFLLPGDGATQKSLVHASTVADATIAAALADVPGAFVLADREAPSMRRLADSIARSLGRARPLGVPAPLLFAAAAGVERAAHLFGRSPPVTRDLLRKAMTPTVCSPARLEAALGVACHVDLDRAIDDEVGWMRSERLI